MKEENKDIDQLFRSVVEPMKMDAPDAAWSMLDAELSKKQALLYKKSANRLRILSILLMLLLISFVTYHFSATSKNSTGKINVKDKFVQFTDKSPVISPNEESTNHPIINPVHETNKKPSGNEFSQDHSSSNE